MENYEIYLMDYFDQQLSETEVKALMLFLDAHPEIKEECEGIEDITLEPVTYKLDKSSLKKDPSLMPLNSVNKQNAEEFFIAHLEKDITESQKEEIRVFLDKEKELQKEFNLTQNLKLHPDLNISFEPKEHLYLLATDQYEPINTDTFEEYCIAYHEGDLNQSQMDDLLNYISDNDELTVIFNSYAKLTLEANASIVFANKGSLKKRAAVILFNRTTYSYVASIAAVFILLFLFPMLLDKSKNNIRLNRNTRNVIAPIANNTPAQIQEDATPQPIAKPYTRKKHTARREEVTIAKASSIQPKLSINPTATFAQIKPMNYATVPDKEGYYEVTLVENTFATRNPTLVKRVVKGVRNLFNISHDDLKAPENKLTLWDAADVGIKGIGALTENDMALTRR